jgi:amidase
MVEEAMETWARWIVWEFGTQVEILGQVMGADALKFFGLFLDIFGSPGGYADGVMLQVQRHMVARAWSEFFADHPLIVGPTWCQPQFEHGYDVAGPESGKDMFNLMRFVLPANLLGLPAACVPTGNASSGLPLGVQIIGDRFREDMCLDAAEAVEQKLGVITPIDLAG